ncbi:MAG: low molecular weight phosphotyrosine protein phosphatase [Deltaproteobacteria bacterium]|nr:MAG: low molecular weight phosphotyrosine protein phosphatase [Deltaproteobacteria bacterium]
MQRILFVCLGNICRSPAAEAIMKAFIAREGLMETISCDSAGTIDDHRGQPADPRMQRHASRRGYTITSISRPVDPVADFLTFDWIVGMDDQNIHDLRAMDPKGESTHKIFKMTDFCRHHDLPGVPDPYYGGARGFETVLDILEDACEGLLERVRHAS